MRDAKYLRRNDLRDEGQDRQVGVERDKFFAHFRRFQRVVLTHGDAKLKRLLFDRIEFSLGRIGRAVDRDDLIAFADEFLQSFFRECALVRSE